MDEFTEFVLACPECRKLVKPKKNRRKDGTWRCHFCRKIFSTPAKRSRTYYTQVLGYRTKKVPKFDELGHKIMGEYDTTQLPILRRNKRAFKDDDIIKRESILSTLQKKYGELYKLKHRDLRNAAFICFLFLTGARVDEVVGMPLQNEKRQRIPNEWAVEPLKKHQISKVLYKKNNIILWQVDNMPVLKRKIPDAIDIDSGTLKKVVVRRNVAIPFHIEKEFIEYIDRWLIHIKDDDVAFPFTSETGRRICYQFNKTYNHYWRHIRATDLTMTYRFQGLQLKHFFGWSSERMANRYAHLTTESLVDSMLVGYAGRGIKLDKADSPDLTEAETLGGVSKKEPEEGIE